MSGMTCQELVELVTAYLDGALDADTERRFVGHLSSCDGCVRYLGQIEETIQIVGRVSEENLPAEVREDLMTAFRDWPSDDEPAAEPDDRET